MNKNLPRLIFPGWFDERAEIEMPDKGWFSHATVETANGNRYPVSFIDPVRLQQDMDEYVKSGTPYFSEPGLIILDEVSRAAMQQAVEALWEQGYFERLKPLCETPAPEVLAEIRTA